MEKMEDVVAIGVFDECDRKNGKGYLLIFSTNIGGGALVTDFSIF